MGLNEIVWILLLMLAVARVTRVITTDKIGEPIRQTAVDRLGADSMITYFVHCRACTSIWIAAALAPFTTWLAGLTWWILVLLIPAASYVTVLAAELETGD